MIGRARDQCLLARYRHTHGLVESRVVHVRCAGGNDHGQRVARQHRSIAEIGLHPRHIRPLVDEARSRKSLHPPGPRQWLELGRHAPADGERDLGALTGCCGCGDRSWIEDGHGHRQSGESLGCNAGDLGGIAWPSPDNPIALVTQRERLVGLRGQRKRVLDRYQLLDKLVACFPEHRSQLARSLDCGSGAVVVGEHDLPNPWYVEEGVNVEDRDVDNAGTCAPLVGRSANGNHRSGRSFVIATREEGNEGSYGMWPPAGRQDIVKQRHCPLAGLDDVGMGRRAITGDNCRVLDHLWSDVAMQVRGDNDRNVRANNRTKPLKEIAFGVKRLLGSGRAVQLEADCPETATPRGADELIGKLLKNELINEPPRPRARGDNGNAGLVKPVCDLDDAA